MISSLRFSSFPPIPTKPSRRPPIAAPPLSSAPFFRCRPSPRRRPYLPALRSAQADSWADLTGTSNDGVGGWFIRKSRVEEPKDGKQLPGARVVGVGASAAILLAALSYFCYAKKGFRLGLTVPFHVIHEKPMPARYENHPDNDNTPITVESPEVSEAKVEDEVKQKGNASAEPGRKQVTVPVAADSTQQEALSALKKLEIMENDVNADELCTRREYARWLAKTNYLERNPKYKMLPRDLVGVTVAAFDDVSFSDPDFWCIQSLAEAGIVLNKLSSLNSTSISDNGASRNQEKFHFFPESLISRFDLLNWKAILEYPFSSGLSEKILRTQVGFLDIGSVDASPQLLLDLMAGENSITRRAFGNTRCLQPKKPVTKAQAAVVLSSGRMADAIHYELSRLEAENTSRSREMEEIRSELIQRGDIQRSWQEKLTKEQARLLEVENKVKFVLLDLEDDKAAALDASLAHLKEKASLDRLQQLLQSQKDEVDEMYDKLTNGRANILSEQQNLEKYSAEIRCKQDAVNEAKLNLETEIEATRILRSWVKEEALQMRNRADILAQAALRWQYNGASGHSETFSTDRNGSNFVLESDRKSSIP